MGQLMALLAEGFLWGSLAKRFPSVYNTMKYATLGILFFLMSWIIYFS